MNIFVITVFVYTLHKSWLHLSVYILCHAVHYVAEVFQKNAAQNVDGARNV